MISVPPRMTEITHIGKTCFSESFLTHVACVDFLHPFLKKYYFVNEIYFPHNFSCYFWWNRESNHPKKMKKLSVILSRDILRWYFLSMGFEYCGSYCTKYRKRHVLFPEAVWLVRKGRCPFAKCSSNTLPFFLLHKKEALAVMCVRRTPAHCTRLLVNLQDLCKLSLCLLTVFGLAPLILCNKHFRFLWVLMCFLQKINCMSLNGWQILSILHKMYMLQYDSYWAIFVTVLILCMHHCRRFKTLIFRTPLWQVW